MTKIKNLVFSKGNLILAVVFCGAFLLAGHKAFASSSASTGYGGFVVEAPNSSGTLTGGSCNNLNPCTANAGSLTSITIPNGTAAVGLNLRTGASSGQPTLSNGQANGTGVQLYYRSIVNSGSNYLSSTESVEGEYCTSSGAGACGNVNYNIHAPSNDFLTGWTWQSSGTQVNNLLCAAIAYQYIDPATNKPDGSVHWNSTDACNIGGSGTTSPNFSQFDTSSGYLVPSGDVLTGIYLSLSQDANDWYFQLQGEYNSVNVYNAAYSSDNIPDNMTGGNSGTYQINFTNTGSGAGSVSGSDWDNSSSYKSSTSSNCNLGISCTDATYYTTSVIDMLDQTQSTSATITSDSQGPVSFPLSFRDQYTTETVVQQITCKEGDPNCTYNNYTGQWEPSTYDSTSTSTSGNQYVSPDVTVSFPVYISIPSSAPTGIITLVFAMKHGGCSWSSDCHYGQIFTKTINVQGLINNKLSITPSQDGNVGSSGGSWYINNSSNVNICNNDCSSNWGVTRNYSDLPLDYYHSVTTNSPPNTYIAGSVPTYTGLNNFSKLFTYFIQEVDAANLTPSCANNVGSATCSYIYMNTSTQAAIKLTYIPMCTITVTGVGNGSTDNNSGLSYTLNTSTASISSPVPVNGQMASSNGQTALVVGGISGTYTSSVTVSIPMASSVNISGAAYPSGNVDLGDNGHTYIEVTDPTGAVTQYPSSASSQSISFSGNSCQTSGGNYTVTVYLQTKPVLNVQ